MANPMKKVRSIPCIQAAETIINRRGAVLIVTLQMISLVAW